MCTILLAEALALLGTERAMVVTGEGHFDEVTIAGPTRVTEVADGKVRRIHLAAERFRFAAIAVGRSDRRKSGGECGDNSSRARRATGSARDMVVINAAAALCTAGRADTPVAAANMAATAISSGAARDLLTRLVDETNR